MRPDLILTVWGVGYKMGETLGCAGAVSVFGRPEGLRSPSLATGLLTALLIVATVVYSFQRFENQTAYRRGHGAFWSRVAGTVRQHLRHAPG